MLVRERPFGSIEGRSARAFTLDGGQGLSVVVSDFGARLIEVHAPDRHGQTTDVVLGLDDAAAYASSPYYFGATIGRYANRIRRGRFSLEGAEVQVDCNEGPNHLHGGRRGWDMQFWSPVADPDGLGIAFRLSSPDGDMGFPGACEALCSYRIEGLSLRITMEAVPDRATLINMAHHSYLNLAGHGSGGILDQQLRIPADFYLPVDEELLPTGEVRFVSGTRYDFRSLRPIGDQIDGEDGRMGYDHNWCLSGSQTHGDLHEALEAYDPESGRRLVVRTTEPGIQVYTGSGIGPGVMGKSGSHYGPFAGFTLEAQKFPDSPNLLHFPSAITGAGQRYRQVQVLEFSAS